MDRSWKGVAAAEALGARFSTLSGWKQHVDAPLWQVGLAPPVDPRAKAAVGCAV